mgnify:CR=1 FL=1
MLPANMPYPVFTDANGEPLEDGYLYFGVVNQNPETNPIAIYWDAAGTQPAAQPVRTLNGYPSRNGTPSAIYVPSDFSITLRNKKRELVFYSKDSAGVQFIFQSASGAGLVGFSQASNYPADSVGEKLQQVTCPIDAPYNAAGTGLVNDRDAVQAAINSGAKIIDLAGKTFRLDTKITFSQEGQLFRNGTLLFNGDNTQRLGDVTADNVTFENVTFHGNEKQPRSSLLWINDGVDRPRFLNCTFKKLTGRYWGSSNLNAMYAVLVSPYGVTNFEFTDCLFQDLIKYNDGVNTIPVTPAFVGGGFVGAVCFLPENLNPGSTPQTVVTQGTIQGCVFENIQTIRAAGLSVGDSIEFNDADAIRTYGDANTPSLFVRVSDCVFRNVSKRCFKFRAEGSVAHDNECYAADLPYGMTSPIDLTSNTKIVNLKIYASTSKPVYNAVTWSVGPVFNREALIQGLFVSHCQNGVNFFSNPDNESLDNLILRDCQFNQCYLNGIVQSSPLPNSMDNIVIENTQIYGGADVVQGLQIIGTTGSPNPVSTGLKINNVYINNGAVYIDGTDNDIKDLTVEISSATFTGPNASANLIRIGSTGFGGFQNVDGLFINAWNLDPNFLSVTRQVLNSFIGDNGTFKNVRIKVPQGLGVTYPHLSVWGREMNIEGLQYDGPGRVNVGTENPVSQCSISNSVRLSNNGSASTEPFFYISNAATGEVTFNNVIDFRPTTARTIEVNATSGSTIAAFNVVSNTSNADVTATGGVVITGNVTKFGAFTQAYALSNVSTSRTLNASTITTAQLASVVGTLINDLKAVGFVRF